MDTATRWIFIIVLFGPAVGSFLNVVIFRLPRGLSIHRPNWSFCAHCRARIRPYDNVPILSWLLLRGRCRDCGAAISAVYPLIECMTLLLFIAIWDALFIGKFVPEVGSLSSDWLMAVAYFALFAGLLATAGMDIESYAIDIRVCIFCMVIGVACHGAWGIPEQVLHPSHYNPTGALPPALCLIGGTVGLTWFVTYLGVWLFARRAEQPSVETQAGGRGTHDVTEDAGETGFKTAYTDTAGQAFQPLPVACLACLAVALIDWQALAPGFQFTSRFTGGAERGIVTGLVLMLILILASLVKREADGQIIEEIEAQRGEARSMALREFAWFIPALAAGIGLFVLLRGSGRLGASWEGAIESAPGLGAAAPFAAGALRSFASMVFAAALGWSVRILGTLAFGKEAFGTGDIYIMAAIGAVAGFWVVVYSFFLAAILALVGVLATLFRKSSRAIPFGPWLALAAFFAIYLQSFLLEQTGTAGSLLWEALMDRSP